MTHGRQGRLLWGFGVQSLRKPRAGAELGEAPGRWGVCGWGGLGRDPSGVGFFFLPGSLEA